MDASPERWPPHDGEMAGRIRDFDWAATPLGPIRTWSPALKVLVQLVLSQETPSCVCLGAPGTLVYNDAWAAMVGGKHPRVLGTSVLASFGEIEFADLFHRVLAGETVAIQDFHAPYERDGAMAPAWFDVHYVPARDEVGAVLGMFVFVRDNTARVQAEALRDRLLARQRFLLELADGTRAAADPLQVQHVAMALLAAHLRVDRAFYFDAVREDDAWVYVIERDFHSAPGLASMVGRYRQADFGVDVLGVMDSGADIAVADVRDDPRIPAGPRDNYLALGVAGYVVAPVLAGGRLVGGVCLHTATPRAWTGDEVALVRDVAERTWEAVERARVEATLREADRRKDEFLAMLAHELRNPIFAIGNASRALQRSGEGGDSRWCDIIARQAQQLGGLVDDLLDVHGVVQGHVALHPRPCDLGDIVRAALATVQPRADDKAQTIALHLPPDAVPVSADAMRLEQVVQNLVGNAIKYSDLGGRIDVAVEASADEVVLRVRDDGIGMAPATLERVFDLFEQGDPGVAREQGGLGVGLTIARRLVELHGGTVTAGSAGVGQGAEFVVRLPRAAAAEAGDDAERAPSPTRAPAVARVLVVDDQPDCADSLAHLLADAGFDVRTAYGGAGALAEATAWEPGVVLLDIGMPGADGYEVARLLRRVPGGDALRLIAVSGYGQPEDVARAFASGFDAHFLKPVSMENLVAAIAGTKPL